MKKKNRIKKNEDFQKVFKHGKSMANRQFVIYMLDQPEEKEFRLGLSVSKKIGNAVTRNRIKRLIRQVFMEEKENLKTGIDYIVIARNPASEMNYHEVQSSLMHLFRKTKVYKMRQKRENSLKNTYKK
ncbi:MULTISPECIES: ribonuclease P protein component [Bacillaceae]|uniref:ribonuclease P protein component n=1 Tax=Bacillaceae TaxID=186817 RepID=UPI000C77EB3F|nr:MULTISPECIES: ribonuclease P protein component [Bacillaceae]PLR67691.1 ribonuclease P protein component [Bacillus sp. UMB0893]QNG59967.1 ribonuclease P protein component [Bacillus sp. PAMC26568]